MRNIIFRILLIYPLIDLILNFINNKKLGIFYNITICILLVILEYFIIKNKKMFSFFIINIFVILMIYMGYITEGSINFELISFINFVLAMTLFSNKNIIINFGEFIIENRKSFNYIAYLYIFLILFSCVIGDGYNHEWGIITLKGPYMYSHTLAYLSLAFYSTSWFLLENSKKNKKTYIGLMTIFSIFIILTAVRSAVLAFLVMIFVQFKRFKLKKKFQVIIMCLGILFIIFNFTNFMESNPLTLKNENTLEAGSISNGRDVFWKADIDYFKNYTNLDEKILGVGITKLKQINYSTVGLAIHAHNDLITSIVAYGILGFITFLISLICVSKFNGGIYMFIMLMILLSTNGLFMYFSFVICIPYVILIFNNEFYKGDINGKSKYNNTNI